MGSTQSYPWTTADFSAANGVQLRSVLKRLQNTGSYYGVEPLRLANRRLLWPAVQVVAQKKEGGE